MQDTTLSARSAEIRIETNGAAAVVTFDRPQTLNALNVEMRASLAAALPRLARDPLIYCMVIRSATARAFSVGGDVRELVGWARDEPERARAAFRDEYRLCWALDCFTKPTVSLIDGMVMGSGVGMTLYGTHRVAGPRYRFAMPETAIGLYPDVGVAHAFARLEGHVGMYLGLTGRAIGRADALRLGLVTHCIEATHFDRIVARLADAYPVDAELASHHADPGPGELREHEAHIAAAFSAGSVAEILDRLRAMRGGARAWAEGVVADLATRSPTSLAITFRHIRAAAGLALDEVLAVDYRLACRFLEARDFAEGVRAALIDKDQTPIWRPGSLADVTEEDVARYFAPLAGGELGLPLRGDMQK